MPLTDARRAQIADAHALMRRVPYRADLPQFGRVADWWEVAAMRTGGDCEDVVLLARRHLIDQGWDHRALRPTLCRTAAGAAHCVLMIVLDDGELVLDREQPAVKLPSEFRAAGNTLLQRWAPDTEQWEIVT